jgi:hypothetical protein
MTLANALRLEMRCPRCGVVCEQRINCYFGCRGEMKQLSIGDEYPWVEGEVSVARGARPRDGTAEGSGWVECATCGMDFFVLVDVRRDRLVGAHLDPEQLPQGHDGVLFESLRGPSCVEPTEMEVRLYGGVGGHECRYLIGDAYVVAGDTAATATLRSVALCGEETTHEVFVVVEIADGRISTVRIDPNQRRYSERYRETVIVPP